MLTQNTRVLCVLFVRSIRIAIIVLYGFAPKTIKKVSEHSDFVPKSQFDADM